MANRFECFVQGTGETWGVVAPDGHHGPYLSVHDATLDAIEAAMEADERGHAATVWVRDGDGQFHVAWSNREPRRRPEAVPAGEAGALDTAATHS